MTVPPSADCRAGLGDFAQQAFARAPDAIYVSDRAGRLLAANERAYAALGYEPGEMLALKVQDFSPEATPERRARVWRRLARNPVVTVTARHRRKDGTTFPVEVRLSRVEGPAEDVLIAIARDTSRRPAERRLRRELARLARLNTELEQFAIAAAHDLQEPLRGVTGFTGLLRERYLGRIDGEADRLITFAAEGARRMQAMIQSLLELSRLSGRPPRRPADLNAVLADVLADLGPAIAEAGATVTVEALPIVTAAPAQMARLFQNLVGNALKFRGCAEPDIRISGHRQGGAWRITVADNGIGMRPEQATRIFQMFRRLHPSRHYPGNGMGLALCRKIVQGHGGRIWVETAPGKGSAFHVLLPEREIQVFDKKIGSL